MLNMFFVFLVLAGLLTSCQTEGINSNRLDALVQYPYTNGSRIHSPPKGNCLVYAAMVKSRLKKVYGIQSRIVLIQIYDKGSPLWDKHAIVVYQADNGKIQLADNNHEFPVLAKQQGNDTNWANQMMPPMADFQAVVISHDYKPKWDEQQLISFAYVVDPHAWKPGSHMPQPEDNQHRRLDMWWSRTTD